VTRRVAVTGVGLVSSLGHDYGAVLDALRAGKSGVRAVPEWLAKGLRSGVAGTIECIGDAEKAARIPARLRPGMSPLAVYACIAARQAAADAGLADVDLGGTRTACAIGTSSGSPDAVRGAAALYDQGKVRRIDPFLAFRCMTSAPSAAVANLFGLQGRSYSIGSACATGAHNIGHAFELIRSGAADRALAGGTEEVSDLITVAFDALRLALSSRFNDRPAAACRPFDADRDGVVVSGGAGIVVLEEMSAARARGARVRAEIAGFGANSDTSDLVTSEPEGRASASCMRLALEDAGLSPADVDYVNAHATGTQHGDAAEARALRAVFGGEVPPLSSTKSMTGHALGAAGALEAIFCVGMLERGFVAPSINVDRLDPVFEDLPVARQALDLPLRVALTNSFGFGGTNACLVLSRFDG
jgi:3-oxoacyl-[acyl-carrier-protein] synthase I